MLAKWHKQEITWAEYDKIYIKLLKERDVLRKYGIKQFDGACFLCSEETTENCHRRLLVEYMKNHSTEDIRIIHLK